MDLGPAYPAIYDFGLLPYALGDVLTWNIQTAIRAKSAGLRRCDIYICKDENHPANVYQRDLILPENSNLFFNELFAAFGTHPDLGNIHIYNSRTTLMAHIDTLDQNNAAVRSVIEDYKSTAARSTDDEALKQYFLKYLQSHEQINAFYDRNGEVPLLGPSRGCEPDIRHLREALFGKHRIVAIHPRMRRLDAGIAGEHTYYRDSDFLEWFEFVATASRTRPDIKFVVLGRIHEKPLHLLRLPNVISLRALGLGLGHELTLMREADLFIGTSSGFAAYANFSKLSYFITRMNSASAIAYAIKDGEERLPFATQKQHLVYGIETTDMLLKTLDVVPQGQIERQSVQELRSVIDPNVFQNERRSAQHEAALSSRFRVDGDYADQEAAFLIWPRLQDAFLAFDRQEEREVQRTLANRILLHFPNLKGRIPALEHLIAVDSSNQAGAAASGYPIAEEGSNTRKFLHRASSLMPRLTRFGSRKSKH